MNTPTQTDERIDYLLHAFATTAAPSGLEQRIAARLAQRTAAAGERSSIPLGRLFSTAASNPRSYAIAATALLAIGLTTALILTHTQQQSLVQQQTPATHAEPLPAELITTAHTLPSAKFSPAHQRPTIAAQPINSNDPDAIALAETLAPSHPAPPLPLTAQEALMLRSTRQGQPIQLAELDTLHESALIAATAAHERNNLLQFVHGLLGPLATTQTLTPSSAPQNVAELSSSN